MRPLLHVSRVVERENPTRESWNPPASSRGENVKYGRQAAIVTVASRVVLEPASRLAWVGGFDNPTLEMG